MILEHIEHIPVSRKKPFLILEAGVNHEGSLSKAMEMVEAAAESGADMIKFQSYKADTLASRHSKAYWDQSKEPANSQYELFKKHDSFNDDDYMKLSERCQKTGILFCSTAFDNHFIDFLEPLMPVYKIAAADITNYPMLQRIAGKKKPIILSTGASYINEIHDAMHVLTEAGARQIALMHCVLEYPTLPNHANLESIPYLQSEFSNNTIGWSDHVTPENGSTSLMVAWLKGADILEKHFTLDKSLPGNDHYHAMNPDDIKEFIRLQKYTYELLGENIKTVLDCEEPARLHARRSIVAAQDIPKGANLTQSMFTEKRPGTGIPPSAYSLIIGQNCIADIRRDDLLQWNMLPAIIKPTSP